MFVLPKLNIVIVTNQFFTESHITGISMLVYKLAQILQGLGHNPIIVVSSDKDERTTYEGLQVHRVNVNEQYLWKRILQKLFKKYLDELITLLIRSFILRRYIKEIRDNIDISIIQYVNTGGTSFFRIKDIPTIVTITMHTGHIIKMGFSTPKSKSSIKQRIFIENRAMKKADAIFGPNKMVNSIIEKDIKRKVELIETPYYSDLKNIDYSFYSSYLKGKQYLLYFGLIDIHKGIDTIADIIYPLLDQFHNLIFVFIGKQKKLGNGQMMMEVVYEKALNHKNRVLHLETMNQEQLYPIIDNALAVIMPSKADNFPNTCIEAMALKKIVVASRGCGFGQLIVNGVNGFLIEVGDHNGLLETIIKIISLSPEKRAQMGEKAHERIQDLTPEKIGQQLIDFYYAVIRKKSTDK